MVIQINRIVRYADNFGKSLSPSKASAAHICSYFVRGRGSFPGCKVGRVVFRGGNALDKMDGVRIIVDRKGTLQQAVNPYGLGFIGLQASKNRHRAGWRFLLLSF